MDSPTQERSERRCLVCQRLAVTKNQGQGIYSVDCPNCGNFWTERETVDWITNRSNSHPEEEPRGRISAMLRRAILNHNRSRGSHTPRLSLRELPGGFVLNPESLLSGFPPTVDEQLLTALLNFAGVARHIAQTVIVNPTLQPAVFCTTNPADAEYFVDSLVERKWIERILARGFMSSYPYPAIALDSLEERKLRDEDSAFRITLMGWSKVDELRAGELRSESKIVFVARKFEHELVSRACQEAIHPAIVESGLRPYDLDSELNIHQIDTAIARRIRESRCVVADLTEGSRNVYYEIGYAHSLRIPVIILCEQAYYQQGKTDETKRVAFDVDHYPVFQWDPNDLPSLRQGIVNRIRAFVP